MHLIESDPDRRQPSQPPAFTAGVAMDWCGLCAGRWFRAKLPTLGAIHFQPLLPDPDPIQPNSFLNRRSDGDINRKPSQAGSTSLKKDGQMKHLVTQAKYVFFLLPIFLVLACVGAFAQANSTVTGIVTDQTGSGVAGATITLTDPGTGATKSTFTSSTGLYEIGGLNGGNYNMTVNAKGFRSFSQTGIVVNISATFRVDITLTVGAETQ